MKLCHGYSRMLSRQYTTLYYTLHTTLLHLIVQDFIYFTAYHRTSINLVYIGHTKYIG